MLLAVPMGAPFLRCLSPSAAPRETGSIFGGRSPRLPLPQAGSDVGVPVRNQRERRRLGRGGWERGRDISPSLTAPNLRKSPRDLKWAPEHPHLPVSQDLAGCRSWRASLPPRPIPSREEEWRARGGESGERRERGGERSWQISCGGGERRRKGRGRGGDGRTGRRRRRGGERARAATRGEVCAGLRADPGTEPRLARPWRSFPCLPWRPSVFLSGILPCGGRGVAVRRRVRGLASHAPSLSSHGYADSRLLWGPSLFWCHLHPSCALFILSPPT